MAWHVPCVPCALTIGSGTDLPVCTYACRHRERSLGQMHQAIAAVNASPLLAAAGQPPLPQPPTPAAADLQAAVAGAKERLDATTRYTREQAVAYIQEQLERLQAAVAGLVEAVAGVRAPFEWADGPLVQVQCREGPPPACWAHSQIWLHPAWLFGSALPRPVQKCSSAHNAPCQPHTIQRVPLSSSLQAMRRGDMILIDELNLADDAVLERLNRCAEQAGQLSAWRMSRRRRRRRAAVSCLGVHPRLLPRLLPLIAAGFLFDPCGASPATRHFPVRAAAAFNPHASHSLRPSPLRSACWSLVAA